MAMVRQAHHERLRPTTNGSVGLSLAYQFDGGTGAGSRTEY